MRLGAIRYKIWHDLWSNKGRTLQIVAVIAVGAFAVGTTLGGRVLINRDLTRNWSASQPATIGLAVEPSVDETMITSLDNLRGIGTVVAWQQRSIKWRTSPAAPWQPALLVAIEDYEDQTIRRVELDQGAWPKY